MENADRLDIEVELIDGYRAGDQAALREVEGWMRSLLATRYSMLRSEWADLYQAVHVKLLANLEAGSFAHASSFKTYVVRIAHYSAIDLLRKKHRERARPGVTETSRESSPYLSLLRREEERLLHSALHLSSPDCLTLWKMIFLEKLSYDRVADRLQIPLGTVKSRMWKCRKKLRAITRRLENPAREA